jgi:nicotinamidase/pyrazinamidase
MADDSRIFVDIDTQRDFLEPSGALYVPGSDAIIANLARLTTFARENQIRILATACSHTPDDPELTRFGPHCMAGTRGQERIEATQCADSIVLDVEERLTGDLPPYLTLFKRELDVFSRADADELIAAYVFGQRDPRFVVYGVATDYCVLAAVRGLLARGRQVTIVADAVRAIDPAAEERIFQELGLQGVLFTVTDAVCRRQD